METPTTPSNKEAIRQRIRAQPVILFTCGLICTVIVGWLLVQLRDILIPIMLTLVLWFILNGIANWFRSFRIGKWRMSRWFSLLVSSCIVIYAGIFCISTVAQSVSAFAADSKSHEATIINLIKYIEDLLPWNISIWPGDTKPNLALLMPDFNTKQMLQWSANLLSDMTSFGGLVLVYLIFFFAEQANFRHKFNRLFRSNESFQLASCIADNIADSIGKYTRIMLLINFMQGALTYLVLLWLGIDYPAFWAFLTFIVSFIPTIGTIIAVLMPVLMAVVQTGNLVTVLLTVSSLSLIQFTLGTVIGPKMLGDSLNLSSLVVMFALAIWGAAWGVIGMFLAVPITVMIMIICANFRATEKIAVLLSDDGDFSQMISRRDETTRAFARETITDDTQ